MLSRGLRRAQYYPRAGERDGGNRNHEVRNVRPPPLRSGLRSATLGRSKCRGDAVLSDRSNQHVLKPCGWPRRYGVMLREDGLSRRRHRIALRRRPVLLTRPRACGGLQHMSSATRAVAQLEGSSRRAEQGRSSRAGPRRATDGRSWTRRSTSAMRRAFMEVTELPRAALPRLYRSSLRRTGIRDRRSDRTATARPQVMERARNLESRRTQPRRWEYAHREGHPTAPSSRKHAARDSVWRMMSARKTTSAASSRAPALIDPQVFYRWVSPRSQAALARGAHISRWSLRRSGQ